ncbi:cyclophilin-like fold protein [Shewanella bicestrii]|uniref:cyclophilin-like fold protein n=1 Tax=Shewanella bicestrii TaxID=2018305 RepID=UPI00142E50A4|nr:cyclophilin-like fold protein [Shewanella bicestrii]
MNISVTANGKAYRFTLLDNPTAKDFYASLPLKLTLKDYGNTEKIAMLEQKLTKTQAPKGTSAKRGDITYYAPWGNLALFYRDYGYADGLIPLGTLSNETSKEMSKAMSEEFVELLSGNDLDVVFDKQP